MKLARLILAGAAAGGLGYGGAAVADALTGNKSGPVGTAIRAAGFTVGGIAGVLIALKVAKK